MNKNDFLFLLVLFLLFVKNKLDEVKKMEYVNGKVNLLGLEYENLRNDRYYYFIDNEQEKYYLKYVMENLSVITNEWGILQDDIYAEDSDELQEKVNDFFNRKGRRVIKYGLKFD